MAKMTIDGNVFEGTTEELRELFEMMGVKFTTQEADESSPSYKTEKRHAKVGERILITNDMSLNDQTYALGDVLTVTKANVCSRGDVYVEGQPSFVDNSEYEGIVEPTQTKPKLHATSLTHKGADYTLVDRKAQSGDVVVFTETGGDVFKTGTPYEVGDNVVSKGFAVYRDTLGRTETNVLVYEKVAVDEPLKVGDTVEVIDGSQARHGDFGTGIIGEITDIDEDFAEAIRVDTEYDYDRFPASALRKVSASERPTSEDFDKFPKGAKVRLLAGGGDYPLMGKRNGEIYTVENNDVTHDDTRKISIGMAYALPHQLELVAEDVPKFNVGDIVMTHDKRSGHSGVIGEVVAYSEGRPLVRARYSSGEELALYSDSTLICPAGSRVDTK